MRYTHEVSTIPTVASALFNGDRAHVFVTRPANADYLTPPEVANAIRAHRTAIVRAGVRPVDAASQCSTARPVYAIGPTGTAYDRTRIVRIETGIYPPA